MSAPDDEDTLGTQSMQPSCSGGNPSLENIFARRWINSPTVKVTIGECPDVYHIHRAILISDSGYFKSCLASGLKESQENQVHLDLEEEYYDAFGHVVQWLYLNIYEIPNGVDRNAPIPDGKTEEEALLVNCKAQLMLHAKINVLAERLCCEQLKELTASAIENIFLVARKYPLPRTLKKKKSLAERPRVNDGTEYVYRKEWRDWFDAGNLGDYRVFCIRRGKDVHTGIDPRIATLFKPEDVIPVAKIIYDNTPSRLNEDQTARGEIAYYCACLFPVWRLEWVFMDFLFENREFFEDVMKRVGVA